MAQNQPVSESPRHSQVAFLLAILAVLAYLPLFTQPFIADDYPNLLRARAYGPVSGWGVLAADPVFRYRATFWVLTYWIERFFGVRALAFYGAAIGLHVVNTWLVYLLGAWRAIGWRVAAIAAAFFAIYEGHQEAVMWYSGSPELLVSMFGLLSLLSWILWLQEEGRGVRYYAAALAFFVLALISEESAVILAPLMLLPFAANVPIRRNASAGSLRRTSLLALVPFVALALVEVGLIVTGRTSNFRFQDGSFSLHAPFPLVWANSFWRLLWFWGLLSLLALVLWREVRRWWLLLALAAGWIAITLVPYSFITYMLRVPSRHTYFASVGLAWVVAAGFLTFSERISAAAALGRARRPEPAQDVPARREAPALVGQMLVPLLAIAMLAHNVGYLWTKKRAQFRERAAPTESLIRFARRVNGPIYLRCFPYPLLVAQSAIELGAGKPASDLVTDAKVARENNVAATFCYQGRTAFANLIVRRPPPAP